MRPSAPKRATVDRGPARVVEALESTRRSMRLCRLSTALVGIALAEVGMAVVIAVADVSWVLPTWVRGIVLLALMASACVAAAWSFAAPARRFARLDAAAEVEATFPELGQRVRTTLEYAEPTPSTAPASAELVEALAADTDRQAEGLDFPTIVPWSRFTRRAFGLGLTMVGVLIGLAYEPALRIAAARLFLRPAHYTNLAVEPGDATVKLGADFTLRARITGRPVASARWLRRPVGSRDAWTETSLISPIAPGGRPGQVSGIVESVKKDCRDDFEYRVLAGEVESDVFRVDVVHPLALKSFEAAIEPPSYARRAPSASKEADFQVLEGSKVRIRIALDRAPRSAWLVFGPADGEGMKSPRSIPLAISGDTLTGDLPPLTGDVRYEIVADSADGMKLEPVRHLIKVKPDEKPTVRFVKPDESYSATPTTEVPFRVEAADDLGVARVGIVFRINDGPERTLRLDEPGARPSSFEALAKLMLEEYKLTYVDSITYHAFVEDNREPAPQRVESDLRYIDILPYKQAFQIVEGGGTCNGTSVTLEELIARQRQGLNRAFGHAEDRPVDPRVADRLSKAEAELAMVTGEFAQAAASQFGPISPLDEATRLMESATVALDSKDVARAVPTEQSALAMLIQARQNLRKILKTGGSSSQARKFDRQQQQKLRKPPAKDAPKEAELARLEQDLRKLAEAEKKFAEQVEPRGGGGPELDKKESARAAQASSQEADRLKGLSRQDPALTDLARERMDQAAAEVKRSGESVASDRPADAAEAARKAADQLDRLADQVAGLKAKELAAKLARARDLAQATAKAERALAAGHQPDPSKAAADQLRLAEQARTLADLMKKAGDDAAEEDRALARAVGKAAESNPPAEIEQAMRRASSGLAEGEAARTPREMEAAAGRLEALARDLEAVRRDLVQPGLERLLAAEKKAAEAQKALDSAANPAKKAEAEKALSDLARAMDGLKPGEGPLQTAADALQEATRPGSATNAWSPPSNSGLRPGLFTPPISYTNAVKLATRALQARIQELILDDAVVDRDGAVPPGYKEMVEDYFRVLSEDLR